MIVVANCPGICVSARAPDDWYVHLPYVEIGGNGFLSGVGGSGKDPIDAITDTWFSLCSLSHDKYIVLYAGDHAKRKHLRWNGFMWAEIAIVKETR